MPREIKDSGYARFSRVNKCIMDTFHSTETFGLNFQGLPVANGRAFSKISKKEDNLMRYPKIFKNFFLKLFFSFNFAPIIDRTFG